MIINLEFGLRLLVAGILGAAIGLEREYRAKEAGYRTHFLVSLGSALLMIVSQYSCQDLLSTHDTTNNMEKESYTSLIQRLEEIVKQVDNGELELDQLSEKLKEANQIIAKCQKILTQTNTEVKKIMEVKQDSEE